MPKLFLDVDDTLVRWSDGIGSMPTIDLDLVNAVDCDLDEHGYELVVWSGQGIQHAQKWAEKAFPYTPFTVHYKDMRIPQYPDVVVDDMDVRPRDRRVRVVKDLRECPICSSQ